MLIEHFLAGSLGLLIVELACVNVAPHRRGKPPGRRGYKRVIRP